MSPASLLAVFPIPRTAIILKPVTDEPATGVAVALFDEAGNVMKNNEEGSDVDISSGAATIPFTVKMVKSGDADPTKGTVQTTVTYNVTYH